MDDAEIKAFIIEAIKDKTGISTSERAREAREVSEKILRENGFRKTADHGYGTDWENEEGVKLDLRKGAYLERHFPAIKEEDERLLVIRYYMHGLYLKCPDGIKNRKSEDTLKKIKREIFLSLVKGGERKGKVQIELEFRVEFPAS